jgi:hypothetical protein
MSRVVRLHSARRPNTALLDARIGVAWWSGLTPAERTAWLEQTRTASPTDCWNAYKWGATLDDRAQP